MGGLQSLSQTITCRDNHLPRQSLQYTQRITTYGLMKGCTVHCDNKTVTRLYVSPWISLRLTQHRDSPGRKRTCRFTSSTFIELSSTQLILSSFATFVYQQWQQASRLAPTHTVLNGNKLPDWRQHTLY